MKSDLIHPTDKSCYRCGQILWATGRAIAIRLTKSAAICDCAIECDHKKHPPNTVHVRCLNRNCSWRNRHVFVGLESVWFLGLHRRSTLPALRLADLRPSGHRRAEWRRWRQHYPIQN